MNPFGFGQTYVPQYQQMQGGGGGIPTQNPFQPAYKASSMQAPQSPGMSMTQLPSQANVAPNNNPGNFSIDPSMLHAQDQQVFYNNNMDNNNFPGTDTYQQFMGGQIANDYLKNFNPQQGFDKNLFQSLYNNLNAYQSQYLQGHAAQYNYLKSWFNHPAATPGGSQAYNPNAAEYQNTIRNKFGSADNYDTSFMNNQITNAYQNAYNVALNSGAFGTYNPTASYGGR
jgi:hypothetical protein